MDLVANGETKQLGVVDVPVKQQDDEGSSGGDYGEVEVDGGSSEQQQQQVQNQKQQAQIMVDVKVKSEVPELDKPQEVGTASQDGKEKTLLTYKRRASSTSTSATAASASQVLVTPKIEDSTSRPVRANRGMKRRYPGDESDDTDAARKPARVRSMTEVFAETARYPTPSEHQTGKVVGEVGQRGAKRLRPKKRGRPSRANGSSKKVLRGVNASEDSEQSRQGLYVCKHEGCDKAFSEPGALYRHARVHGDRPYVCHYEGCNRRFLERSKLKRHYLIHTGEKSFVCLYEGCGKAFSLDFNLRSHMKTHTGEYHECPHEGCEKKYCQNYKLRAHMCKDHNVVDGNDPLLDTLKDVTPEMKAAKKQEKLQLLLQRKEKLDKWKDSRKKRIQELEIELERETRELGKIEKALKKLDREKDQLEIDESELSSSDDSIEPDIEQATCEEKEVLVFAQKLPTADHGARLVQADPRMMQSSDVLVATRSMASTSEFGGVHGNGTGFFLSTSSDNNHNNSNLNSSSNSNNIINNNNNNNVVSGNSTVIDKSQPQNQLSAASVTTAGDPTWSTANHKLLLLQQSELPVTHLFSFQEQPCLVD